LQQEAGADQQMDGLPREFRHLTGDSGEDALHSPV
jgi:hypothetical protein